MKKLFLIMLLILAFAISPAQAMLVKNGATSVITYFVLRDRTNGTVDTGVTVANLEMYYIEDQTAISGDVFVGAHGAANDAYTTGECYHCGYGVYRVDWPNAAFDGGIGKKVQLIVIDGDAGAFTEILEVELSVGVDVITVVGATPITLADMEAEAVDALESFDLDHLLSVTTGVAADGELEPFVSAGTVMAHLMGIGADVSTFNATEDSLEAQGTHLDAAPTAAENATAVWEKLISDHEAIAGSFAAMVREILNALGLIRL